MKKFSFKTWFFFFSVMVFATSLFRLPGVGAEPTETDIQKYSRENVSLRRAITLYHKDMNELFNKNLASLLSKAPDDEDVLPPPKNDDGTMGKCPATNVSTYCMAMAAVDKYDAFREALLLTHAPFAVDPAESDDEIVYYDVGDATDSQVQRNLLIDAQLELSEQALDVTLAAYQEAYLYYNLHTEYWGLIKDLEKYRDGLADVRKQVENYPFKFHNRTTTDCT